MKEVLGDALTPEIKEAWAAAYEQLASMMINREDQLLEEADGWTDWRDFHIS
jgi:nitric oxide dioxygenase